MTIGKPCSTAVAAISAPAYAVVQEALTNAVRHAAPTTARVRVERAGGDLVVEMTDTGRAPGSSS